MAAENSEVAGTKAALQLSTTRNNVIVEQDEDVLDTWFSSGLFAFSALGWPQQVCIKFIGLNSFPFAFYYYFD